MYDYAIELQDGAQPPFGPIYNLLQTKLTALRKYIDKNLSKNFIWHLKLHAGVPILLYRRKMDRCVCAWIIVDSIKLLRRTVIHTINLRAFGATWKCQDLHQD
jgi:hypothetical protein